MNHLTSLFALVALTILVSHQSKARIFCQSGSGRTKVEFYKIVNADDNSVAVKTVNWDISISKASTDNSPMLRYLDNWLLDAYTSQEQQESRTQGQMFGMFKDEVVNGNGQVSVYHTGLRIGEAYLLDGFSTAEGVNDKFSPEDYDANVVLCHHRLEEAKDCIENPAVRFTIPHNKSKPLHNVKGGFVQFPANLTIDFNSENSPFSDDSAKSLINQQGLSTVQNNHGKGQYKEIQLDCTDDLESNDAPAPWFAH